MTDINRPPETEELPPKEPDDHEAAAGAEIPDPWDDPEQTDWPGPNEVAT